MDPVAYSNPPLYSAIAVVTFFAVIFGVIFKDRLEYRVALWQSDRSMPLRHTHADLIALYLLVCLALVGFMACCLRVIAFSWAFAWGTAAVLVLSTGGLIWWQLGSLLQMLTLGGSAAIDLDNPDPLFDIAPTEDSSGS